jgi:hypothetical protein
LLERTFHAAHGSPAGSGRLRNLSHEDGIDRDLLDRQEAFARSLEHGSELTPCDSRRLVSIVLIHIFY